MHLKGIARLMSHTAVVRPGICSMKQIIGIIIQYIVTLPKYGNGALDIRRP